MTMTRRDEEPVAERRKQRSGGDLIGQRLAVAASKLDHSKYAYRWINDGPARMHAKTKEDDWDVVMNEGVKDDSADMGNAVSQVVGTKPDGSALLAYLCRKPRKFYDEDRADKDRALDEQLAQLRRGNDKTGASQSDYVPSSGIRMT